MNSREIKFRVWKDNKMQYQKDFPLGGEGDIKEIYFDNDIIWDEQHNGVIMQYVGLRDKTGKEIYEGDIILVPDEYPQSELEPAEPFNNFGTVEFKDGSFGVSWLDEKYSGNKLFPTPSIRMNWMPFPQFDTDVLELDNIEILGNIFEDNKDLVNQEF